MSWIWHPSAVANADSTRAMADATVLGFPGIERIILFQEGALTR
jgi:hypothetical protein